MRPFFWCWSASRFSSRVDFVFGPGDPTLLFSRGNFDLNLAEMVKPKLPGITRQSL